MAVRSPQDIYARHVSSSRGYPMWTPEPSIQFLSNRPEGLMIGDVGVVVPDNGNFDVFFNICLPKDHRFHLATGVPGGFSHIKLSDADIETVRNVESAGKALAGPSVTMVGGDGISLPPRPGQSDATHYSFNFSSKEGAILVLPEGADRHDVRDRQPFFEQASRHAATWYRFAEEHLGRIISHGSLYVITGLHKTRSWSHAAYHNEEGDGDFSARFTLDAHEGVDSAARYRWDATRNIDWRAGPADGLRIPNQSVFIRGFKVALRDPVQGDIWRGISGKLGFSSEGANRTRGRESGMHVEIRRIPEILPVFHPSDVINRYIFEKEPSARVAITHDSDWGLMLDKNLLKPEELVQGELLMKVVSENYTTVLLEGVARLEGNTSNMVVGNTQQPSTGETHESVGPKRDNNHVLPNHSESLSVVSESNYRCMEESASLASGSCPAGLQSIPSKIGDINTSLSPESFRPIKIIVVSDYICSFCYICDKVLRDAMEACRDLPVRFDVEFRPFTLLNLAAPMLRNSYVANRFGKEQAEVKLKAVSELAQKAGLKLAEDSILCGTAQVHRLSTKAYRSGGQSLQSKFNGYIFDLCLAKGADISDEDLLIDAAVHIGLMDREEATAFLRSTECLDCVEKMVEAARAQGINGVPFVIIDGKWAVNGLQPMECFAQIFRKLAHLPVPAKPKNEHEAKAQ